jgi:hypothetical protein
MFRVPFDLLNFVDFLEELFDSSLSKSLVALVPTTFHGVGLA